MFLKITQHTTFCISLTSITLIQRPVAFKNHLSNLIFIFTKMVVVAIAGGSGGLGRTLVEGIQARGKHEVIVLSRKVCRPSNTACSVQEELT